MIDVKDRRLLRDYVTDNTLERDSRERRLKASHLVMMPS